METASSEADAAIYNAIEAVVQIDRNSVAKGALEVIRALERRRAKVIIIARDADLPGRLSVVKLLSEKRSVPTLFVSSQLKLGRIAGLDVSASCVALPVTTGLELS